eukprot:1606588-Amphidinium_carterae.1
MEHQFHALTAHGTSILCAIEGQRQPSPCRSSRHTCHFVMVPREVARSECAHSFGNRAPPATLLS